ncbi:MAG: ABC transporter substrate-binding protein [Puniceicoccales bacterium]
MFAKGRRCWLWLVVLCALCLSACQPDSARPPDTLVIAQSAEPKSLDPHVATSLNDFRVLENVYEGLVRFKPGTMDIEPALAERWEISEDGRVYTFYLRGGVRFHDGSPFNAEAVQYNFERLLDPEHPEYDTGPFPLSFFFATVERVEVVNDLTVRLHLKEPFAPLLANLAYPTGYKVSPSELRRLRGDFGRMPSGTGPFRVAEWQSNRFVRLERYEGYWGTPPKLAQVYFKTVTDENARLTELLSGAADLIVEVSPDMIQFFRDDAAFQVYEESGPHLWFLIFNLRSPVLEDVRVRQAINYAIDKQGLTEKLLQGTASVAAGPVPKAFGWAYDEALQPYPYDPGKARELINAAETEGAPLTLFATESGSGMLDPKGMAEAIQADLAAVGLDVTIETYEWNTYLSKVNGGLEGQADMAEMAWMTNDPDTLPFLTLRSQAWPEQGGFNSGYYANEQVDQWLEQARRETDLDKRAALYRKVQQVVHEEAPWAVIASWRQNAVASGAVHGLRLEPSFLFRLNSVTIDNAEVQP